MTEPIKPFSSKGFRIRLLRGGGTLPVGLTEDISSSHFSWNTWETVLKPINLLHSLHSYQVRITVSSLILRAIGTLFTLIVSEFSVSYWLSLPPSDGSSTSDVRHPNHCHRNRHRRSLNLCPSLCPSPIPSRTDCWDTRVRVIQWQHACRVDRPVSSRQQFFFWFRPRPTTSTRAWVIWIDQGWYLIRVNWVFRGDIDIHIEWRGWKTQLFNRNGWIRRSHGNTYLVHTVVGVWGL